LITIFIHTEPPEMELLVPEIFEMALKVKI
jgi:hypothetical protein